MARGSIRKGPLNPPEPSSIAASHSAPGLRLARLLGLLGVLIIAALFYYPSAVYPSQSLALHLVLFLSACGLAARQLADAHGGRADWLRSIAAGPVLFGLALALWAALRWSFMLIPFAGRELVLGQLWFAMALATGVGLATVSARAAGSTEAGVLTWSLFRRLLVILAILFAAHAVYQYLIAYPRMYRDFRAEHPGPVVDLQIQSLLHALKQRRIGSHLGDSNLFAALLAALSVFCLGTALRREQAVWRAAGALGWGLSLLAVIFTRSRGGLLAFILAAILVAAFLRPSGAARGRSSKATAGARPRLISCLLCAALIGALLLSAGIALGADEGWFERLKNVSTIRERFYYWLIACRVWGRHPLVGEGPGGFELLYLTLKPAAARESQFAHSWFFQTAAELGLIGLVLSLGFWTALLARLRRSWSASRIETNLTPTRAFEGTLLLIAAVALGFSGLIQFTLEFREFLVLLGILVGGACALTVDQARRFPTREKPPERAALALACLVVLAVPTLLATPRWHFGRAAWLRGNDLIAEGQPSEARAAYERAHKWQPDHPAYLIAQAGAMARSGQVSEAWPLLTMAADANPLSASVAAAQSRWLAERRRLPEALVRIREAIQRYPTKSEYRLDEARMALEAGDPEIAREALWVIERTPLLLWEYEELPYQQLRERAGLEPEPPSARK